MVSPKWMSLHWFVAEQSIELYIKCIYCIPPLSKILKRLRYVGESLPITGQVRLGEELSQQHAISHVLEHGAF